MMISSIFLVMLLMLSRVMPAMGSISYLMGVSGYCLEYSNMMLIWYSKVLPLYGLHSTVNL